MALENERLRELLREHGIDPMSRGKKCQQTVAVEESASTHEVILFEGDGKYSNAPTAVLRDACGSMNALCVSYCQVNGTNAVVCGGVDKMLRIYDISDPSNHREMGRYALSAPILSVSSCGHLVACSLMDGGVVLVGGGPPSMLPSLQLTRCRCRLIRHCCVQARST